MSMMRKCCCEVQLGRCCMIDIDVGEQDCADDCVDGKTWQECVALGGHWQAGTCADENGCKGVCCATDAQGYFVACQEGVTQCECFSDNLAPGVTTNWTPGPELTCADISCPCQCIPDGCVYRQYVLVTKTTTHFFHCAHCPESGSCYNATNTQVTTEFWCDDSAAHVFADGTLCSGISTGQGVLTRAEYVAYVNTGVFDSVEPHIDDCDGGENQYGSTTIEYTAANGITVPLFSTKCNETITVGTNYISRAACVIDGDVSQCAGGCACVQPPYYASETIYHTPAYCTFGCARPDDCAHRVDDCTGCA